MDGKARMKQLWVIFWTFFKIGPVTFGGGYAMIPMIGRVVVEKRKWISDEDMSEMLSLAGSAPGGIGVNTSIFIGYRLAGIRGAIAAVAGITLPTFLIICILALTFAQFEHNPKVEAALEGIHSAIIAFIIVAVYKFGKSAVIDKTTLAITLGTVIVLLLFSINPVLLIAVGLFIGILCIRIKEWLGIVPGQVQSKPVGPTPYKFTDYYIADGI
jgi:chromate transporter